MNRNQRLTQAVAVRLNVSEARRRANHYLGMATDAGDEEAVAHWDRVRNKLADVLDLLDRPFATEDVVAALTASPDQAETPS